MAPICGICCDTVVAVLPCNACEFSACKSCTAQYLLQREGSADCMSCHAGWDRDQLIATLGKKWVEGDWKVRRENLLFERERGMMPATQIYMIWQAELSALKKQKKELQTQVRQMNALVAEVGAPYGVVPLYNNWYPKGGLPAQATARAREASRAYHDVKREEKDVQAQIRAHLLADPTRPPPPAAPDAPAPSVPRLAMPCPAADCMGFVLRDTWKCGMCNMAVCKACHVAMPLPIVAGEIVGRGHTCKHEDVLTANELAKQTKPCPHCAVPTFRISGCNQMWCIVCHKCWNWKTGKPEGGVIHNPHYFDWRREQVEKGIEQEEPRGAHFPNVPEEDIVPGAGDNVVFDEAIYLNQNMFGVWQMDRPWRANPEAVPPVYVQLALASNPVHRRMLDQLNQRLTHLWVVERPKLLHRELTDNMDLRIKYMRKELTDTAFKRQLQQREKKHEKFTAYAAVITAHCIQARNQLREMVRAPSDAFGYVVELTKLWASSHARIEAIADKYDAVPPKFFQDKADE